MTSEDETEVRSSRWSALYDQFRQVERVRAERERRTVEEDEALREFENWCRSAIEQLMVDIRDQALERSQEFERETSKTLQVQYPSGRPIVIPENGPEIRFLKLSLGEAQVHVYSSHATGGVTHVHLLPSRSTSLKQNHRLVSEPGAFIVRLPDNNYELRYMKGDPEGPAGSPMSIDTLLFRALTLLVSWSDGQSRT